MVAVLAAADLGRPGGPGYNPGLNIKDQLLAANDPVRYVGVPVAVESA